MHKLKNLILANDEQKYEVAQNLLNEIITNIHNSINIKIEEAILCLFDENKTYDRFKILCSYKKNNNFECEIIEPQIIDKFSISYIAKKPYFDKNLYVNYIKSNNFYFFIYIKSQNIYKYLNNLKELLERIFDE